MNLELGELAVPSEATIHFKALSTAGQVNQHFDLSIASAQAETVTWYNLIVGEFKGMSRGLTVSVPLTISVQLSAMEARCN